MLAALSVYLCVLHRVFVYMSKSTCVLSACLMVWFCVCVFVRSFGSLCVGVCACVLCVRVFVCMFVCMLVCLFVRLSVCVFVCS